MIDALFEFFAVFGAAQILYSLWRKLDRWLPVRRGHLWGTGHKVGERIKKRGLRHEWRKCKRCNATQERYKLTRRGSWYLTDPVPPEDLLPGARVVEK